MTNAQPEQVFSNTEKKIAWVLIPLLVIGLLGTWFVVNDSEVAMLNAALAQDEELQAYPYTFRALQVEEGVAVLSSPRSSQSSVLQALKIIHPELSLADTNAVPVVAAQKELARLQNKAQELVSAQPGVSAVRWELDKGWLRSHGAYVE